MMGNGQTCIIDGKGERGGKGKPFAFSDVMNQTVVRLQRSLVWMRERIGWREGRRFLFPWLFFLMPAGVDAWRGIR